MPLPVRVAIQPPTALTTTTYVLLRLLIPFQDVFSRLQRYCTARHRYRFFLLLCQPFTSTGLALCRRAPDHHSACRARRSPPASCFTTVQPSPLPRSPACPSAGCRSFPISLPAYPPPTSAAAPTSLNELRTTRCRLRAELMNALTDALAVCDSALYGTRHARTTCDA